MSSETVFRIAFWILLAGVFAMRSYFALQVRRAGERLMPDREAVQREGRELFAVRVMAGLLLGGWVIIYAINPAWIGVLSIPFPGWLRWAGFALGLASLAFWIWTQVALGKQWSPQLQLRKQHQLITTGPYSYIRHPLYTAMLGYSIGVALVTANWVFAALVVVMVAGLPARVSREEQMMMEKFGDEYKAYMRSTGRFFPK